jgi:glutamyl-Q tRNA(Asp) synthetase
MSQPIYTSCDVKRAKAHNMVYLPIMDSAQQGDVRTRFAPSPNGALHLGHAYSALCAHDFARACGGDFLLRLEDIDGTRSRPEHIAAILADIEWLGLMPDGAVQYQSANVARYADAFERLKAMGLLYRCTCTRSDIAAALKLSSVPHGPDGPHYPGTCRGRCITEDSPHAWRLDITKALALTGPLKWSDLAAGAQFADPALFGDVVLWRKDAPASYHLAATVDDAADGISHVVRGKDLFAYTAIHRLLQELLGLPEPVYWHHPLLLDSSGEKLAKSKSSPALHALRLAGESGAELIDNLRQAVLPLGICLSSA